MIRVLPARVDLRAFHWRLAPLERKLEDDLETARAALSALRQEEADLIRDVEVLERTLSDQARHAAAASEQVLDAHRCYGRLYYLAGLVEQIAQRTATASRLRERIEVASKVCIAHDVKLGCLRRLRESATDSFAREQMRRESREADLAWLTRATDHAAPEVVEGANS